MSATGQNALAEGQYLVRTVPYTRELAEGEVVYQAMLHQGGLMYVAGAGGVGRFDGVRAETVEGLQNIRLMQWEPAHGTLYAATPDRVGRISTDARGRMRYTSYEGASSSGAVWLGIYPTPEGTYFLGELGIFWLPKGQTVCQTVSTTQRLNPYVGGWLQGAELVVVQTGGALYRAQAKQWQPLPAPGMKLLGTEGISFIQKLTDGQLLIATAAGRLFTSNGVTLKPFSPNLPTLELVGAVELKGGRLLLATAYSGCLVLDRATGRLVGDLNTLNGLPENDVQAIVKDPSGNVWLAHNRQLSLVLIDLPVRTYPSLLSPINDVAVYAGRVYLATDDGVYYLPVANANDYVREEKRTVVLRPDAPTATLVTAGSAGAESPSERQETAAERRKRERAEKKDTRKPTAGQPGQRASLFGRLLGSKKSSTSVAITSAVTAEQRLQLLERTVLGGLTPDDVFLRIPELPVDKYYHLLPRPDGLWLAAAGGLYRLTANQVERVASGYHRRLAFTATGLWAAVARGVVRYTATGKQWQPSQVWAEEAGNITHMEVDAWDGLWISGRQPHAWRITWAPGAEKPFIARAKYLTEEGKRMWVVGHGKDLRLVTPDKWLSTTDQGRTQDAKAPLDHRAHEPLTWQGPRTGWLTPEELLLQNPALTSPLPRLLPPLTHAVMDAQGVLWAVAEGRLFRMNTAELTATPPVLTAQAPALLRVVVNSDSTGYRDHRDSLMTVAGFSLPYGHLYDIVFELAFPGYLGHRLYEYRLNGGPWRLSADAGLRFSQLAPGDYTLEVAAQDAWGQRSASSQFSFTLKQPYWNSGLFQFLELLVAFLLLSGLFFVRRAVRHRTDPRSVKALASLMIIFIFSAVEITYEKQLGMDDVGDPIISFVLKIVLALLLVLVQERLERWLFPRVGLDKKDESLWAQLQALRLRVEQQEKEPAAK